VFVAGGATYSEVRDTYQLSSSLNKDIYIGSTHVLTPRNFVDDLKVVDLGGVGSRYLPNGLKERSGGPRPFQQYYDEKYYTKDAPPKPPPQTLNVPGSNKLSRPISPISPRPSSYTGSAESDSTTQSYKEKKEKKRGFLRF
jgi:syntaxin-binding protein 1